MNEKKTKRCFDCASLGDCPYADEKKDGCELFVPSQMTHEGIANIVGIRKRIFREYLQEKDVVRYILRCVRRKGYHAFCETYNGKLHFYLKIRYKDRLAQVQKTAQASQEQQEQARRASNI